MLMTIGSTAFEVAPLNMHGLEGSGVTEYAIKDVAGAEPPLEYVGEGANTLRIAGRLFPLKFGGLGEYGRLDQARTSGEPQYVMRGDGKPLGWFVIERLTERHSFLDARGVGKMIDFDVELRRSPGPLDGAFFSIVAGLL
jgi:phage protein U